MTIALSPADVAASVRERFPGSVIEADESGLIVRTESLLPVAAFLKGTPDLEFDYLASLTAVDYRDYFELVYHLTSLKHNHSLVLKTRCSDRNSPVVSSLVSLWQGADLQEREVYDLMGIRFEGHPNLKRIFLWEGFNGYPLRKDWKAG